MACQFGLAASTFMPPYTRSFLPVLVFPDQLSGSVVVPIDHFTVVCSVTWPLSGSEAGRDLVLIQTSLLLRKSSFSYAN